MASRHFAPKPEKSEAQVGRKNKPVKVEHLKRLHKLAETSNHELTIQDHPIKANASKI